MEHDIKNILAEHKLWLEGAGGRRAVFNGVDFGRIDLSGANLKGAHFDDVSFDGANLEGINLEWSELANCRFEYSNLRQARLGWSHILHSTFSFSDLRGANFCSASTSEIEIVHCGRSKDDVAVDLDPTSTQKWMAEKEWSEYRAGFNKMQEAV